MQPFQRFLLIAFVLCSAGSLMAADKFVPLFDGKTLDGWVQRGGKAKYEVKDGCIVGTSVPNTPNSFLCTEQNYGDFILEYEYKCHPELNSGVQIRSHCYSEAKTWKDGDKEKKIPAGRVHGYQCEIDANKLSRSWMSGIYEEGRRGWLYPGRCGGNAKAFSEQGKKLYKPEQWNHVRIEAIGDHIVTYLNGEKRADFHDDASAEGFIGLQVHGVGKKADPLYVMWRNIRIQKVDGPSAESPAAGEWIELFNGKDINGWEQHGGKANYKVEDGAILGTSVPNTQNTFLCTKQRFGDFELEFDVMVDPRLNSGVQIRSNIKEKDRVWGPQVEIELGPGEAGYIYGEATGRGWLSPKQEPKVTLKKDEWNHYRVVAQGNNIKTWINGQQVADLTDDKMSTEGIIGLQVHGVGKKEEPLWVKWKDIRIRELSSDKSADAGGEWIDLFNGKNLDGWKNPYKWGKAWVEDGEIRLQADKKFFLVTEKTYGNFELQAEIRLPDEGRANSGIMFRCHAEPNKVFGYQAECDPSERAWTGGLYDEGRRTWLHPKRGQEKTVDLFQAPMGEWIKYRIVANGDHLQIFINGKQTTDFHDSMDASGYIGVQHHGEKGQIYRFRNIRLKPLD